MVSLVGFARPEGLGLGLKGDFIMSRKNGQLRRMIRSFAKDKRDWRRSGPRVWVSRLGLTLLFSSDGQIVDCPQIGQKAYQKRK